MRRMGIEQNVSFYSGDSWKRGKGDMIIDIIWGNGPH
jgi:hypothetical protein